MAVESLGDGPPLRAPSRSEKEIEVSPYPDVRHFAESIRRDESAVNAAMTLPWSKVPVEGPVNRRKTIQRQRDGRAGFPLLKARVLNVA